MQQAMLFPMTVVSPRGLPENSANVYREMAMARQKVTFQDVSISKKLILGAFWVAVLETILFLSRF